MVPCSSRRSSSAASARHLLAGLGGQLGQVEVDVGQPAGQVDLQRLARRRDLGLDVAQVEQHARHLVGGVGRHAGFLDRADDGVVVAHQPGALGPADQRVRQRNSLRPRRLGLPPRHHRVERGLRPRRRRRRRRTCRGSASRAARHAAVRRCHARHRCATGRRSAAARPTAAPSSPSRNATRRRTDRRPPAAPRTGTAASASGRP